MTGTGDHAQTRFSTGERPRVRSLQASGSPADDGLPAPRQPQAGTLIEDPAGAPPPSRDEGTAVGPDFKPPAGDESLQTVNLASRMAPTVTSDDRPDDEGPGPDTTAALEMRPTADLSSRLGPTAEGPHPPR